MFYRELQSSTREVMDFSDHQLGGGEGQVIIRHLFPGLQLNDCYENVRKVVGLFRGEMVCGWHIRAFANLFLEAEAHAVWREPTKGMLLDVTPSGDVFEEKRLLFIQDRRIQWVEGESTPIASRFYILCKEPRVERLIALQQRRQALVQQANVLTAYGEAIVLPPEAERLDRDIEELLLDIVKSGLCDLGTILPGRSF